MKKIFLILGKACAGKDTVVKIVSNDLNIPIALSSTTRPMREGEIEGIEYKFLDREDFFELLEDNELAEYTNYKVASGEVWHYGLTRNELEKDDYVLAVVNPEGMQQIKSIYRDSVITIEIQANDKARIKRYLDRDNSNNIEECFRRWKSDEVDFLNIKTDYIINENSLEANVNKLKYIINTIKANDILKYTQEEFKKNPYKFLGGR